MSIREKLKVLIKRQEFDTRGIYCFWNNAWTSQDSFARIKAEWFIVWKTCLLKNRIYTATWRNTSWLVPATPDWLGHPQAVPALGVTGVGADATPSYKTNTHGRVSWPRAGRSRGGRNTPFQPEPLSQGGSAETRDCKQFNFPKIYSKSESSLQQPYWLKWEWKDLDTSRDSGLSIGTAFFYSSCLWYFLSLNNLSCLSKTDAA